MTFISLSDQVKAQIVPDATLPVNSTVTPQGNTSVIEGGTSAGTNLFHSFQQFSIPTNGTAFFNNAAGIQNILTRVTGGSISNIDGLIQANGTANLFLINPNGIIFGPNAALNIGGSFLASTASLINFADGTQFNATSPQTTPLLTVSVPVGLQMGPNPGNIAVQGPGNNLSYDPETFATIRDNRPVGLQVAAGQTLALLGGNLALEGGNLTAEGGRIELGSVAAETLVTLTPTNQGMALSYPGINNFQDISLSRAASVDASGAGGGDVFVAGRRVTLSDGSAILALTEGSEQGGTLSVRASEVVEVIGISTDGQFSSSLRASVQPGATGEGGNLTIETARLRVSDGAQVSTSTFGPGKGGNLTVQASDTVEVIGTRADGQYVSALRASAAPGATGEVGNLTIETARLRVSDGAQVVTTTYGSGKAGNLTVQASDMVELIGTSTDGQIPSVLAASAEPGATGSGGNLTIETARLRVSDGALVSTGTFGSGKGGNLTVKASNTVEVIGRTANGQGPSALSASVNEGATGEGGNLAIETARLRVSDGAYVSTATYGSGKAGNLTVKASDTVELIGTSADGQSASALAASAEPGATGSGGNLTIETARLRVVDGAYVSTNTFGSGKVGNLTVQASDTVELIGTSTDGQFYSALAASAEPGATGEGGNLTIETARLRVVDGADVSTNTFGPGKGGNLTVQASDTVELIGTSADGQYPSLLGASAAPEATGEGGNVNIETARLRVSDGAQVSTGTFGSGKGGNLTVKASDTVELIGTSTDGQYASGLFASVQRGATGEGGNLAIETARLRIINGAQVGTNTYGSGKAGNLTVKASDTVELIGTTADGQLSSALGAAAEPGATGEGGNLTIETARLRIIDGAQVGTDTFGSGKAGNLTVKASDTVELIGTSADGQIPSALGASAARGATGEGGNVSIETARLRVSDGAQVGTDTFGPGKAGNLTVKASDTVELIGRTANGQYASGLSASAQPGATGEGGNLTIETARLRVSDGARVSTSTFGSGKAGNLTVKASDSVEVIGTSADGQYASGLSASVRPEATGEGGNLTIETARLRVADGAIATVSSLGEGKAGNLRVDAGSIGLSNTSSLTAETSAGGGTIELRSPSITLRDGSSISTNASGGESGGNIDVRSSALILRQGSRITTNATGPQVTGGNMAVNTDVIAAIENSDISANSEDARGGNITINAQAIFGSVFRTPEDLERLLNTSDPLLLDPARLPSSDITATGADSSLSGTVSVNTPNVDPAQGLLNLPETPVDATQLVASTCRRGKNQSEFNVTGRGGLPPNPYEAIADEATWIDLRPIAGERANSRTEEQIRIAGNRQDSATSPIQLIEAQGWIINSKGQVELIAQVPGASPHNPRFTQQQCPLN
ncbi:filamentous hemagglutinin N-terminal domain-containing protein [Microcoleus sp. FACHB-68]|nr:filamentous hemagglutinin N-terminal domain-containing protein [Microcoleus sp. FACHB-68]